MTSFIFNYFGLCIILGTSPVLGLWNSNLCATCLTSTIHNRPLPQHLHVKLVLYDKMKKKKVKVISDRASRSIEELKWILNLTRFVKHSHVIIGSQSHTLYYEQFNNKQRKQISDHINSITTLFLLLLPTTCTVHATCSNSHFYLNISRIQTWLWRSFRSPRRTNS